MSPDGTKWGFHNGGHSYDKMGWGKCLVQRSGRLGRKKVQEERVDGTDFVWSDATGICGLWDGSCQKKRCGAGMEVKIFTQALGWHTVHKQCEPVLGEECSGCRILWVLNGD